MGWAVRIERDSVNPAGERITTVVASVPAISWPQLLTYRMWSRNAQSNRAVPTAKLVDKVRDDPFVPAEFKANKKGMEPGLPLDEQRQRHARNRWLEAADNACRSAEALAELGVHKQWANRVLAPFQWLHVVITATDWQNFFDQRIHEAAQEEISEFAVMVRDGMAASTPDRLGWGEWHLPFVRVVERTAYSPADLIRISSARSARVSYVRHDGYPDPQADLVLYDRLAGANPRHASPLEHPAQAREGRHANFRGWSSWRWQTENPGGRE
jgi:hypothetical protein